MKNSILLLLTLSFSATSGLAGTHSYSTGPQMKRLIPSGVQDVSYELVEYGEDKCIQSESEYGLSYAVKDEFSGKITLKYKNLEFIELINNITGHPSCDSAVFNNCNERTVDYAKTYFKFMHSNDVMIEYSGRQKICYAPHIDIIYETLNDKNIIQDWSLDKTVVNCR